MQFPRVVPEALLFIRNHDRFHRFFLTRDIGMRVERDGIFDQKHQILHNTVTYWSVI